MGGGFGEGDGLRGGGGQEGDPGAVREFQVHPAPLEHARRPGADGGHGRAGYLPVLLHHGRRLPQVRDVGEAEPAPVGDGEDAGDRAAGAGPADEEPPGRALPAALHALAVHQPGAELVHDVGQPVHGAGRGGGPGAPGVDHAGPDQLRQRLGQLRLDAAVQRGGIGRGEQVLGRGGYARSELVRAHGDQALPRTHEGSDLFAPVLGQRACSCRA
ncbi:hypothetical protein VR44_25280 [Streptomyces katrae]|uniref:Uncharacterized protein n=1 Tax=Streptomyces katrae TaxID=68223 RepID=A0A0F4J2N0_9ACTN|nr:hypothetical protein VR44_25280 [Streptomyces katrae]